MQDQTSNSYFGIDLGLISAGFFGALILALRTKNQTPGKAASAIFAGALCANYLTPILLNFMPKYIQDNGKYGAAFILGFVGLKTLELIYDFIVEKIKTKKGKVTIDINM
jgi:hypothetical protein